MLRIDPLLAADWDAVRAIYAEGIAGRTATFETETPSWEGWDAGHLAAPLMERRSPTAGR